MKNKFFAVFFTLLFFNNSCSHKIQEYSFDLESNILLKKIHNNLIENVLDNWSKKNFVNEIYYNFKITNNKLFNPEEIYYTVYSEQADQEIEQSKIRINFIDKKAYLYQENIYFEGLSKNKKIDNFITKDENKLSKDINFFLNKAEKEGGEFFRKKYCMENCVMGIYIKNKIKFSYFDEKNNSFFKEYNLLQK